MIRLLLISFICMSHQLSAQEFLPGWVVTHHGDTLHGLLFKYKKKNEETEKQYQEIKFKDAGGVVTTFDASYVKSYQKNNFIFKGIHTPDVNVFAQVITNDHVLLMKSVHDSIEGCRYFFRKRNEKEYSAIPCSLPLTVVEAPQPGAYKDGTHHGLGGILRILTSENSYRDFFLRYFSDCAMVVKKLRTGFFTSSDTEEMFKEYNTCLNK
jgi:hypothetical protein